MNPDTAQHTGTCSRRLEIGLSFLLFFLLLMAVGTRFYFIRADPAINITNSGVFFTDEGSYLKGALLWVRFGELTQQADYNIVTVSPLFSLYAALFFKMFGAGMIVARVAVGLISLLPLLAFYRICRELTNRNAALGATLVAVLSFNLFTYSRFALTDPFCTALTFAALWLWVAKTYKQYTPWVSLGVCVLAFTAKVTYAFAFGTLFLLWMYDALVCHRRADRAGRTTILGAMIAGVGLIVAYAFVMPLLFPQDYAAAADVSANMHFSMLSLAGIWKAEVASMLALPVKTKSGLLIAGTLLWGLSALVSILVPRLRPNTWRPAAGVALYLVAGLILFGSSDYSKPRYFIFAIYSLALLTAAGVFAVMPRKFHTISILFVAGAYAWTQAPLYYSWLKTPDLRTLEHFYQEVCVRIEADLGKDHGEVVVIGPEASTLALYCENVRPIDLHYGKKDAFCERIAYWKPQYLLSDSWIFSKDAWGVDYESFWACEHAPKSLQPMGEFRPLPGYAEHFGTFRLFKMIY